VRAVREPALRGWMMKSELLVLVRRFLMHLRIAEPHGFGQAFSRFRRSVPSMEERVEIEVPPDIDDTMNTLTGERNEHCQDCGSCIDCMRSIWTGLRQFQLHERV